MKKRFFLLFALGLIGISIYYFFARSKPCQLTTPDIVGFDIRRSEEVLGRRGMTLIITDTVVDKDFPPGSIVTQFPSAGVINCDTVTAVVNQ
jgi:beta-lactam-binding protein with PASTA domain